MNNQSLLYSRAQPMGLLTAFRIKLGELQLQWQQTMSQRRKIARVMHELSSCSDRQLADLGLRRSDIPDVAHGLFSRA